MNNHISEVPKETVDFQKLLEDAFSSLEQERKELDKQKEEFQQMTKKLADFHVSNKVVLDIGGTRYATSLDNLQKVPDTFLSAMFSGTWELKPDSDGSYFIDRDGTNFRYILNYLRNGELTNVDDPIFLKELLAEAEFYQISPLICELKKLIDPPENSALLTEEYVDLLNNWLGGKFSLKLLFRASRDGFTAQDFHSKCDDKEKTITVIQDTDLNIFGGFTCASWKMYMRVDNNGQYKIDDTAFIFTLKNQQNIPPTKYPCSSGRKAIYCSPSSGPVFGAGHDILVGSHSNTHDTSFMHPGTYCTPMGSGQISPFAYRCFKVAEMEVFQVV